MNNFKDIQSIWDSQENDNTIEIPKTLRKKIKKANSVVNDSHAKTIIILAITAILVTVGYFLIIKQGSLITITGLVAMLLALIVRIGIEVMSLNRKKKLDVLATSKHLAKDLSNYYMWRKRIHKFPTLLTVSAYILGVGLLFIEFRVYLTSFWFNFFLMEFVVIALVLFFFIRKKIRQEVNSLAELIAMYEAE